MAIRITDECINCGACEPECPNNAIYEGGAEWRFSDGTSIKGMFNKLDGSSIDADSPQHQKQWILITLFLINVQNALDFTMNLNVLPFVL